MTLSEVLLDLKADSDTNEAKMDELAQVEGSSSSYALDSDDQMLA